MSRAKVKPAKACPIGAEGGCRHCLGQAQAATFDSFLSFWSGKLTVLSVALRECRTPALPPAALRNVEEAYFACNRAQSAIENHRRIRPVVARKRKTKRKASK